MNSNQYCTDKIHTLQSIKSVIVIQKFMGNSIVFTNGVFDLLHLGHSKILNEAAAQGHYLVVGLNTDASVKRLKGNSRPINDEPTRATLLSNFICVDAVILFEEDTPINLINNIMPDVLVKGGDYTVKTIIGATEVLNNGGKVVVVHTLEGHSTTNIITKIDAL